VIDWIIVDDDEVMRAHMRHPKPHLPKDKGTPPLRVYKPTFMADLGHQKKTLAKKFYVLADATVGVSQVTSAMVKQYNEIWGYTIR